MDREGFRNRMKQYKEARGLNPLLKYWEWRNSLPDNLKYTNDAEYDMQGAYEAGMLPEWNEQDQSYHLGSRDPRTGRILKKFGHPTYYKALEEDAKMGYKTYVIGNNTYTWHDKDGVFVPWLNLLTKEDIPKYGGGGEVYYAGTLPEVVVVPEKWQKDFSENFGDSRIRRNVYRSIPIYAKLVDFLKARRKYYELLKLEQLTEDSRKAFKNKVDSISNDYYTVVEDPNTPYRNVNDEIKRLYDVWNAANRPEITSKNSIFGDMFGFETPHWNPVNNSIHNTADLHTIISELAHPIQYKAGDKNRLDDYLLGLPKAVYGRFSKHYNAYGDKNHYEYDTHHNIEPALQEYISHGKNTKYLNSFSNGGEVTGPPTYEDWLKSLIKNDLWMHPDYYMAHSLNTATKALKLASAGLPGREATSPVPASVEVKGEFPQEWAMNNLYNVENPKKKGVTKKYAKMYDSRTLGAGVDVVSGHPELYDKAKRFGIEKELADEIAYEHIVHDDQVIRDNYADIYGKAAADTLSFGPRFLVAQARYQLGNVRKGWDEIHKALAKGDAEALKKAVLKVTPEDHDYRKKWVKNFNVYGNEPE